MSLEHRSAGAPTRDLATWVSALKYDDLPQRTREVARIALLDTLGVTPARASAMVTARLGTLLAGDPSVTAGAPSQTPVPVTIPAPPPVHVVAPPP